MGLFKYSKNELEKIMTTKNLKKMKMSKRIPELRLLTTLSNKRTIGKRKQPAMRDRQNKRSFIFLQQSKIFASSTHL